MRGYELSSDDHRRGSIIEQLMCDFRADVSGFDTLLDQLEMEGLIRRSGDVIEVVEDARPLVRVIAAAFDANLAASTVRHSCAV